MRWPSISSRPGKTVNKESNHVGVHEFSPGLHRRHQLRARRRARAPSPSTRMPASARAAAKTSPMHSTSATGLRCSPMAPCSKHKTMDLASHWIWNEACPADIAQFEGRRIALLGPPPYKRLWRAGRQFQGMPGELTVERILDAATVNDWIHRIAHALRGSQRHSLRHNAHVNCVLDARFYLGVPAVLETEECRTLPMAAKESAESGLR